MYQVTKILEFSSKDVNSLKPSVFWFLKPHAHTPRTPLVSLPKKLGVSFLFDIKHGQNYSEIGTFRNLSDSFIEYSNQNVMIANRSELPILQHNAVECYNDFENTSR